MMVDFKAILVATDFSDCAGAAFKVAKIWPGVLRPN